MPSPGNLQRWYGNLSQKALQAGKTVIGPNRRRSDRVFLELDIELTGAEASVREFMERTQTLVLSRHGAKILSSHVLAPQQEVVIKCLKTSKEAAASIVGAIGQTVEGYYYGIAFVDPEFNLWDIEFPSLLSDEAEGNKAMLECLVCRKLETVSLGIFELEVLLASQRLVRFCARCGDSRVWRQASETEARRSPPVAQAALPPRRTQDDRRHPRLPLRVQACIQLAGGKEALVVTENASLGGIRFNSEIAFPVGANIELAVPYVRGGVNIFVPARIVYLEKTQTEGVFAYGVCYITERAATSSGAVPGASR